MTTFTIKHQIVNGPSMSSLIDALKYAYDKHHRILSYFTLENGATYGMRVEGLTHEDGSGFSFNIDGTACFVNRKASASAPEWINNATVNIESQNVHVRVYYNAHTQKGVLKIEGGEAYHQFSRAAGM